MRSVGAGLVRDDLVFDPCTLFRSPDAPGGFVEGANGKRLSFTVLCLHPVHILGKVPDLVKRVPHRQLKVTFGRSRSKIDVNLHQVVGGMRKRHRVADRSRFGRLQLLRACATTQNHDDEKKRQLYPVSSDHALVGASKVFLAELGAEALAAMSFNRWGSFS